MFPITHTNASIDPYKGTCQRKQDFGRPTPMISGLHCIVGAMLFPWKYTNIILSPAVSKSILVWRRNISARKEQIRWAHLYILWHIISVIKHTLVWPLCIAIRLGHTCTYEHTYVIFVPTWWDTAWFVPCQIDTRIPVWTRLMATREVPWNKTHVKCTLMLLARHWAKKNITVYLKYTRPLDSNIPLQTICSNVSK